MNQRLELVFRTQGGKKITLLVPNPQTDLQYSTVRSAMDCILAENIFTSSSGDLVEILEAKVLNAETTYIISPI